MLRSMKSLEDYAIGATDGTVGQVKDFYFDDQTWVVRYLVVDTGTWLANRSVLISPIVINQPDWIKKNFSVSITKAQVKDSPAIDTQKPVSRQHEMDHLAYYGFQYYWGGGGLWGAGMYPNEILPGYEGYGSPAAERAEEDNAYARSQESRQRDDDPHLRSCNAVVGYHIHASDGDIGHVWGLLMDEETWAIRYLVVDTSNWWLGHKVLIAPPWIKDLNWVDGTVSVNLTRQAVKDAPAYDAAMDLNRTQERGLHEHYGQAGYWSDGVKMETDINRK
ncbi:PRC-barrel domain containing protein [Rhodoferax sediminis]|uniref:PRC-barrel domain containing protein n=2 Tax=Rhodoferax sediminis TaxID=2509614 RepID=A0A515D8P8_9BURK|nr:PRC-barrel domain containing protein [Rhodoferax sediminis]